MRVFAVDPGVTHAGWALAGTLGLRKDRVRWVDAGHDALADVLARLRAHDGPVIIEDVIWMANKNSARRAEEGDENAERGIKAGPSLLLTKGMAMLLAGVSLERQGVMPMMVSSTTWRRAIVGRRPKNDPVTMDARVKYALSLRCEGMPAVTSNHARDAMALAVYGLAALSMPAAMRPAAGHPLG